MTIGIPAYNRPDTLTRALDSVARQDYPRLQVIVSDDCSPAPLDGVIDRYRGRIADLHLIRNPVNVGLIRNALSIVPRSRGEYFMWLADDDEISANYVSTLVGLLERDPGAVTAMGNWILMRGNGAAESVDNAEFPQSGALARVLRFTWRSDDAFFYGVHRTAALERSGFAGFWWPNKEMAVNWCYVYICDLVLQGKILKSHDPTVQWIGHNYTVKDYSEFRGSGRIATAAASAIRTLNVRASYVRKSADALGLWAAVAVAPVGFASVLRAIASSLSDREWRSSGRTSDSSPVHVRMDGPDPQVGS